MVFREHFRGVKEWSDSTNGCITLNTSSDKAAKLYDACVSQLCGWYNDKSLGGLVSSVKSMNGADPEFILGKAFGLELELLGSMSSPDLNPVLAKELEELNKLLDRKTASNQVTEQERLHVNVVNCWSRRDFKTSTIELERLSTLYPDDACALKFSEDNYFKLGTAMPMRNSLAVSLAKMSPKNPLKGYVHGMYAFALEESNMYDESKRESDKALEMNPADTWAIHSYAHCLEMQAKPEEGLKWLDDRRADWKDCDWLASHQYWHTALFKINLGQFEEAVGLLGDEVLPRFLNSPNCMTLHDATSMMYRMELIDLFKEVKRESDQSQYYANIFKLCEPHKDDHLSGFNDAHYMMSFLGSNQLDLAQEFIKTLDKHPELIAGATVVKPLLEAMLQFKTGAYEKCVDLLEKIRFDIINIGNSHAQRDIFEHLLAIAALKSHNPNHNKLGQRMLEERDVLQGRRTIQTKLIADAGAK